MAPRLTHRPGACGVGRPQGCQKGSETRLRVPAIFDSRFKRVERSQPLARKNFACAVGQISGPSLRVLLLQEGRCARHETLRRDAVDATEAMRRTPDLADGEVVWSWRPDAGVQACERRA